MQQKTKNIFYFLLFFLTSFATPSMAQPSRPNGPTCAEGRQRVGERGDNPRDHNRQHFDPEVFKKELQGHIVKEVRLTPAEVKAYFPVFWEMKDKQRNVERKIISATRRAAKNEHTEADCQRTLKQLDKMKRQALDIELDYTQRLTRIVGARKQVKVMQADHSFGRKKFRQMMGEKKK